MKTSQFEGCKVALKQDPEAWINYSALTGKRSVSFECESELASEPLYLGVTQPTTQTNQDRYSTQKREWVGLTDEQKLSLEIQGGRSDVMLAELVEQWLRDANS